MLSSFPLQDSNVIDSLVTRLAFAMRNYVLDATVTRLTAIQDANGVGSL